MSIVNERYANELYGKHRIPKGIEWNKETRSFEWKNPPFDYDYQLAWEHRFFKMWSELTPLERAETEPIQPPYTEDEVVEFLERLKKIQRERNVLDSVLSLFEEREAKSLPILAIKIEPLFKEILPWMISVEPGSVQLQNQTVELTKPFLIGKYPVTQKLWESVMGNNPSRFKGAYRPVEQVSWNDCVQFCNEMSEQEELEKAYTVFGDEVLWNEESDGYRLPTEAEWEYAARAGTDFEYAGSDRIEQVGWVKENSGFKTHSVGKKMSNDWGLYDMSGNVYEWCWDGLNQKGLNFCSERVNRGGSWLYGAEDARVSHRHGNASSYRGGNLGFRLCRFSL